MLFNSFEFLIFLPIVFLLYWFVFQENLKIQNAFILLASYLFYGWWDWRFLALIVASSAVDYWCGLQLAGSSRQSAVAPANRLLPTTYFKPFQGKNLYLTISILLNLGLLGFFKYFNFFIESASDIINLLGFQAHASTLNLILPVGISFYTFQTMSYTIDVYRGKMEATKDPIAFFSYVAFFPQLVAGPIERASHLLPQFLKMREFEYQQGSDGMKLILWGLFKKVVVADNCALVVNPIFENYQTASGLELIMGAILFSFQIYGDFSGYSDIAIGTAKLFGFDLMTNFRTPYFSRDIAEFWRRWHISLSTWFRDYVYIPLGGSRVSKAKALRNIFIVFLVSGFWHGANWTFIAWGGIHAALFIPLFVLGKNRTYQDEGRHLIPTFRELIQMIGTFTMVTLAWVFFRAASVGDALGYLNGFLNNSVLPENFAWIGYDLRMVLILFLGLEWLGRFQFNWLERIQRKWYRYPAYLLLTVALIWFGADEQQFIYFQF
ncbi:MBOAT family O-acyltransferase [Algoriphagus mannitolivorans]|uniref:MBOAT family O-acyltransferase n=1 Tax=Algoriphagus mannitolivorans TaxID=226504 RepID=UPI000428A492|nr:MBOAT family O-acyltransferase [Algoriphagus mannitolivorans]